MDDYVDKSEPKLLARILRLGATDPAELAAVLQHELTQPVQFDLDTLDSGAAGRLQSLSAAHGLLIRSFSDLLYHPNPPLELLRMTKDYAKACCGHPKSPFPHEIASLLYIASITAALVRCGHRITDLDDPALSRGIRWLTMQSWLDEPMRLLLTEGLRIIEKTGSFSHDA